MLLLLKIFYLKYSVRLSASGDLVGAEKVLEKVLSRKPDIDVLTRYANLATARKDWGAAVDRWERVISACGAAGQPIPKSAAAQLEKARLAQSGALRKAGDLDEAERLLERVLETSPDHVGALAQHAGIASGRKDWGAAVDRWERVISTYGAAGQPIPKSAAAQLEKACLAQAGKLRKAGDLDRAEAYFLRLLSQYSNHKEALKALAEISAAKRDWSESVARWTKVHDLCGDDGELCARANIQIVLGKHYMGGSLLQPFKTGDSPKIVLIGGSPSSGTTIFLNYVAAPINFLGVNESGLFAHPGIYFEFENFSNNLTRMLRSFKHLDEGERLRKGISSHAIASSQSLTKHGMNLEDCINLLRLAKSGEEYVHTLVQVFSANEPRPPEVFFEKMPGNLYAMPYFLKCSNDFNGLCIVRDPLDVVSSLSARGLPLLRAMAIWTVEAAIALRVRCQSSGIIVRYEDFVSSPDTILSGIYSQIGVAPSQLKEESPMVRKWPQEWRSSPQDRLSTDSIGRGSHDLDNIDKAVFAGLTLRDYPGPLLDDYIGCTAEEFAGELGYSIYPSEKLSADRVKRRTEALRQRSVFTEPRAGRSNFYETIVMDN